MRNKQWLRWGLASLSLAGGALGAFLVACGDDDSGSSGGPPDTGTDTNQPPNDAQPDTNQMVDAGQPAKILGVNAITDLGPGQASDGIRVCFGLGPTEATAPPTAVLPPLPDRAVGTNPPGIYVGTGGAFSGTGTPLNNLVLVPYIMSSDRLAQKGVLPPGNGTPGTTCSQLLTNDGGVVDGGIAEGVDFWKLPAIPAGTLGNNKTILLVVTGCASNSTETTKCGPGFTATGQPGNGNLKINIYDLDRATPVGATSLGAQYVHAAAPAEAFAAFANAGGARSGVSDGGSTFFFKGPSDGGADANDNRVALYEKTNLVQVPNVNVATDFLIYNGSIPTSRVSFAQTQAISFAATGGDAGTQAYATGKAFTFISVGDPTEPQQVGGQFNTKTFHFLGFPNDPVVTTYAPPAP